MKILYSCLSKSWGGMEMVTITGIKQLLKRNISVEFLCAEESRLHIEANNLGIIIHPIKSSGYFNLISMLKISRIIKKENFSLIHTHASKDLWYLVPALNIIKSKIPLVLTKHVGSYIIKKDFLHKKIYNRVTKAIAISNVIKDNLLKTCPLNSDKVFLIHNGIDLNIFNLKNANRNKVRTELKIGENELLIGMLARFTPGKGHEEFLHAADELNKIYNNLKFIVVGEASRGELEYENKIKNLAGSLNLSNIIFTGFRSDIPDVLAAMDIFVFPSHAEAFGIALIEAMALGVPSVCSNSDGVLDIALDKQTSLLFENKNYSDLKEKLMLLIENKDLRLKLGANSIKRIADNFNLEILTDKTILLYEHLIKESNE